MSVVVKADAHWIVATKSRSAKLKTAVETTGARELRSLTRRWLGLLLL